MRALYDYFSNKKKRKNERYIVLQLFESIPLTIPPLLNRLPHTRLLNPRRERKKFVDGCSPRGRDRFRRKKRGLDAAAKRCCTMVGEGRDKRVLGRTVNEGGNEKEREGKIREQLRACLVVRSIELRRKRLTRVSLGSVYSESRRGREIPKKFTRNVRRMPRKEDSLTFGTLGWRALPLDYDRSGSIPLSFSRVADLVGTMPSFRCHTLYTSYNVVLGST